MKLATAAALLLGLATSSSAQLITPVSVTGSGVYANNANVISNGVIPAEGSSWLGFQKVSWVGPLAVFTLDFGSVFTVNDILASVDNNDRYRIDYSLTGSSYSLLTTIQPSYGEIGGGMDTMSSNSLSAEYVAGIDFAPVNARYLRIYATLLGGDQLNAIGELQAFGAPVQASVPVPEPSTYGMIGAAGLLAFAAWKRRSKR